MTHNTHFGKPLVIGITVPQKFLGGSTDSSKFFSYLTAWTLLLNGHADGLPHYSVVA